MRLESHGINTSVAKFETPVKNSEELDLRDGARAASISAIDNELCGIERDEILERLVERAIIETTDSSLERAETVLLWADSAMRSFVGYKSVLGIRVPTSLADYMRENSMTASEHGEAYSAEVNQRIDACVARCMAECLPRIDADAESLYECLCADGVNAVNARWQADQYKIKQLANLETDVISPQRHSIRQEVARMLPEYEQLPSIERRYTQLDMLYTFYEEQRQKGVALTPTPLPFKTIVRSIMPSFSPNDTSPKILPNDGKDIDVVYFDRAYIEALTGRDGVMPIPYNRTQYARLYTQAERIGDFGLALWPTNIGGDNGTNSLPNSGNSHITTAADVPAGIVWSLFTIAAVRRGETTIDDDDIKIVLPANVSSCAHGPSSVVLSVYRSNKWSMQPSRYGIAFDLLPQQNQTDTLPELECAYWLSQ